MEPTLTIPINLLPILEELQSLEPLFHAAHADATQQQFEALVAPDFWEVGASGRRYSREFALSVLNGRQQEPERDAWVTSDYHVIEIAEGAYLLTYALQQPGRLTQRSTIWRRQDGAWQAIYHQGTVVQPGL